MSYAKSLPRGVAGLVMPSVVAFGSVGRTISRQDANSATLVASGGVSFSFAAWTPRDSRKQVELGPHSA